MTGCERDLLVDLKKKISSTTSEKETINNAAKLIASQTGLAVDFVENRLSTLLQENSQSNKTAPLRNIKDFFKVGGVYNIEAYTKVRRDVSRRIISAILNGTNTLVRTDKDVNNVLFALQRKAARGINLNGNPISPLAYYINITQDNDTWTKALNNTSIISQYLLSSHLPTVIESWVSDLIKYDINTQKYSLVVDSHIRQDWGDNPDDREAELNSLLEIMCKNTILYKFNALGEVEQSYDNTSLTKNAFFAAMINEVKSMPEDAYEQYIEDPYTIIDYIVTKYKNSGAHSKLEENITHSFVYTWLYNEYGETDFYKNSLKALSESTGYNPLDIIIKNTNKFTVNSYMEYDLVEGDSTLTLSTDENSKSYTRLADNITHSINDLELPVLKNIILKDSEGKYYISDDYDISAFEKACKYFFGSNVVVDSSNEILFSNALQQIIDYRNLNRDEHFIDFLREKSNRSGAILAIMNNINAYNPYSITGAVDNKLGKSLPTIGLTTVASTIEEGVYKNRFRNKQLKDAYNKAKEINPNIITPISPYEHTLLYNHKRGSLDNIFLGTVYRSTMTKEINGETVIKDCGSLSIPEAFQLTIYQDFLNKWASPDDETVRIQAITPSDKPKIPFFEFSTRVLKSKYGTNNKTIEERVIKQFRQIYGQYLLNTVNDLVQVLEIPNIELTTNINNLSFDELLNRVNGVNKWLKDNNITKSILHTKNFEFNNKYNLNKNIADNLDFKSIGSSIQISPYTISAVTLFNSENPFDNLYLEFLKEIPEDVAQTTSLYNDNGLLSNAKSSNLYTFFLLKNILSENILVNTVGVPLSHKAKGKDYYKMDSSAHITMVKRMVALTATMHACLPTALGGLSRKINMMTIGNDVSEMFAYSGNASSGNGFRTELEVADGAMFSLRFADNLLKQSIADTKPKGIDLKLLMHNLDSEKASAYLSKLASFGIDNALLRTYADPNIYKVGGINPKSFMELATRTAIFRPESFNEEGKLVDYNGDEIDFEVFVNKDDAIYEITDIKFINDKFYATQINPDGSETEIGPVDNNLFAFWQNILGGEYSSDANGVYGEQSQDMLSNIINSVGNKINDSVRSQRDVDQYLKNEIVPYFCTSSAQKSMKAPVVNIREALNDYSKAWTIKMDIENFGIQMDPDHTAEDASIREITQLISFITEHGYVPETVKSVYKNLADLVYILGEKTFIDFNNISDPIIRKEAKQKLDNIFAQRIQRVLTNPNENVMGLANEIMAELQNLSNEYNKDLKPPYSDHQVLGKLHTTVGSYLNKFISRTWTGRGDVLVPSHNMFMIYEDDDNTKFLYSDVKYNIDGSSIKAGEYLHNKVWSVDINGNEILRPEYINTHIISPYEVMPVDVYYRIDPISGQPSVTVIDNWNSLNKVRDEILSGVTYIKAIDLPRNLRSKRAFIDVTTADNNVVRVGLYHLKTLQEISKVGDALSGDLIYNGEVWTKQDLIKRKNELQTYWEDIVLKAIDEKNINVLSEELPEGLLPINISYIVFNDERATTNYYSNKFGINNMNFSEIQQRKESYFKEKLINKFEDIGVQYDYLFYTSSGVPTLVYTNPNPDIKGYVENTPIVDEEGYRIDNNENQMYKWPNNAKLFTYKYGNRSVDVIVTNDLKPLIDSDAFALYRSKYNINKKNLYNLNNNQDIIFNALSTAQYQSWLKTNTAVMARIPSQSLAFAMNIDTVAYLPYSNNISFVPNEQLFLQGSDYDIDKAYAIMTAIGYNGIYKDYNKGSLEIVNNLGVENLTDLEIELNEAIAKLVFDNLTPNLSVDTSKLASDINNILQTNSIRVSKDFIINVLSTNIAQVQNDDIRFLGITRRSRIQVEEALNKVLNQIELELFALRGLQDSKKDLSDATQNFILEGIKSVYDSPKTLSAATNPTTMEPINSVVEDMNLEASLRNHLKPSTDIYVNQSTSVGKVDIGISAVAQKAFYAITYYNELKYENNEDLLNIVNIKLPKDWIYDNSTLFSLGFAGARVNQTTLESLVSWILKQKQIYNNGKLFVYNINSVYSIIERDDLGNTFVYLGQLNDNEYNSITSTENITALKRRLKLIKIGDNLCNFVATAINASFISSATDNAKEMKLDLLNASPEILPAYEYLLSIGVSVAQAAKILTDPIIPLLVTYSRGNLFKDKVAKGRMTSIFNKSLQGLATDLFGSDLESSKLGAVIDKLKIYKQIFKGSQELTTIGTTLGINGGIKVELGSPLLYQLNLEFSVKSLANSNENFSVERFFNDSYYNKYWTDLLEKNKRSYNLLDIINSVPHYRAMFEVPIQFKNIMQVLSKDIDNTYTSIYNNMKFKYKIDDTVIRQVLRVFNDRKIFEFLRDNPFKYNSSIVLQQKVSEGHKILTKFEEILYNDPVELSTDSVEGLVTLKRHVENVIIPILKRDFSNNEFVKNLIYNSQFNNLFSERVGSYGSRVNLSDSQYEDVTAMIKSDFYRIQNAMVAGHTIFDWMFMYDLLNYKHTINRNSFSILFDGNIHLDDDNNLITKWIKFVNNYDSLDITYPTLLELSSIPNLESLERNNMYEEPIDIEAINVYKKTQRPRWSIDPNYMPLFVKVDAFNNQTLMNRNILSRAFSKGLITVTLC